ncbi:RNA polymerase sigma factor [Streptomyces lydicus]|uniref:RNA polymerase sigma factor n=1 Tax=Streptomyces lydicus TaxID=47763 RepID=UPI0037BB30DC
MNQRIDQERRELLATFYSLYADQIRLVVARSLRPEDRHQADDIAQDVWLTAWQYLLRGNDIRNPRALLSQMARHRVVDHYRSARVRREVPVDTTARELVAA